MAIMVIIIIDIIIIICSECGHAWKVCLNLMLTQQEVVRTVLGVDLQDTEIPGQYCDDRVTIWKDDARSLTDQRRLLEFQPKVRSANPIVITNALQ